MDKKTVGIIATVATALICGCCALFACIMGFGAITGNGTMDWGGSSQPMPTSYGYVFLCLSVIFIAVPIVVGFVTLRKKPEEAVVVTPVSAPAPAPAPKPAPPADDEPLPPAS